MDFQQLYFSRELCQKGDKNQKKKKIGKYAQTLLFNVL